MDASMGSSCSSRNLNENDSCQDVLDEPESYSQRGPCCRHSVDTELPDRSIAALYPEEDNYVTSSDGKMRSPKSLVDLCVDSICRNLADFDQDIPSGLPQELANQILSSLVHHSALNASTLRALRRCELAELTLSGCRGVNDEWLCALDYENCNLKIDAENESVSNCSSSSYHSAVSRTKILEQPLPTPPRENNLILDIGATKSNIFEPRSQHLNVTSSTSLAQTILLDLRDSQKLTDRGLLHLRNLEHLEIVRLDNCHSVTGHGLLAFSNSRHMHTLTMANCRSLTDEAIINVGHLSMLTSLSLGGCRCLSDISLKSIGKLLNLRKLDISQWDLLTDDALEHLRGIFFLEELSLGWCRRISDKGIRILAEQPGRNEHIRTLSLARCQISDAGVKFLANFQMLQNLDLNGCCHINSEALGEVLTLLKGLEYLDVSYSRRILRSSWQGKIDSLKSIDLCYSAVTNTQLSRFTSLPSLQEINFDGCSVSDWSLAHLADNNVVPNLTSLNLADCDVTDLGMVHLTKFKNLKHLSLFYCNVSNYGLRYISRMPSLETLNLDSRDISDDGLYHLRKLKLKSLDIFSGRITDIGCLHLARIKSLESLELCGGNVGDLGCAQLAACLKNLTSLNLSHNELISNGGASALAALTNLKALNLSYTRVNSEALHFFRGLRQLQSLAMYGCHGVPSSDRAIQTLQCNLPNLKCLRVNGSLDDDGKFDVTSRRSSLFSSDDTDGDDTSSGDESANENLRRYGNDYDDTDNNGLIDQNEEVTRSL